MSEIQGAPIQMTPGWGPLLGQPTKAALTFTGCYTLVSILHAIKLTTWHEFGMSKLGPFYVEQDHCGWNRSGCVLGLRGRVGCPLCSFIGLMFIALTSKKLHQAGFNSSTCTAILDDLPAPLSFDCESGLCFPDNVTREAAWP